MIQKNNTYRNSASPEPAGYSCTAHGTAVPTTSTAVGGTGSSGTSTVLDDEDSGIPHSVRCPGVPVLVFSLPVELQLYSRMNYH